MRAIRRTAPWVTLFGVIAGAVTLAQSALVDVNHGRATAEAGAGDWMSYRRTTTSRRSARCDRSTATTIRQLRPVWSYSMRDNRRWLATPIVANGLMYVPEGSGRVTAFDVVSGDVVWIHERQFPADIAISEGYPRTRGVSIYRDTLYWGTADSYLVALDARTGTLRWEVKTGDYHTGEGHAHPPLIAEGKVFLGHAGGDNGAPGRFRAFDAETGALLWTVNTAPGPGDPGYDTWTRRDVPPLGGAPWNTVSYDPDLRLVYFSTGQPAPWSTAMRGPGDALYTNTVLAVDAQTGKIRWHFQLNPADDWDRAGYENMLVDLVIAGRTRKALIQTGKMGWGVVLDRQTGEFLHAFKTAYDNVVTGWTPQGRPIVNPALIPTPADVDSGKVFEVCPHLHGARNLQAPSYSPITRLYYLGINNSCMDAKVVSVPYVRGRGYTGVTLTAKRAPGYDYVGEFVAFDPVTGQAAWTYRSPTGAAMTASALATAGGIVFGGTADRRVLRAELRYRRAPLADAAQRRCLRRANHLRRGRHAVRRDHGRRPHRADDVVRSADRTSRSPMAPARSGSSRRPTRATPVVTPRRRLRCSMSSVGPPVSAAAGSRARPHRAVAPVAPSTLDGVFTSAQARAENSDSSRPAPPVTRSKSRPAVCARNGGTARSAISSASISTTMPQNNPGSLSPDDYASIVAFYLSRAGTRPARQTCPPIQRRSRDAHRSSLTSPGRA